MYVRLELGSGLWFQDEAGFSHQNEALLQLCVGMYAEANKGRSKGYILHPQTVKIDFVESFCEVGHANFRPNAFAAGKRISMEILGGAGCMHDAQ